MDPEPLPEDEPPAVSPYSAFDTQSEAEPELQAEPEPELEAAPGLSPEENDALAVRALRRHIARHNRQAFLLAMVSLLAAVFLWAVIFVLIDWIALLVVTVDRSFKPSRLLEITDPQLLGQLFPVWFGLGALAWLIIARLLRGRVKTGDLRERRTLLLWVVYELFMAVPNVTFSVWGNFRAIVRLRRGEALAAWRVLQRVDELGGRLPLANVAVEIEDQRTFPHVATVLQIVELLGVRENEEDGWFYYLQNRETIPQLAPPPPERRFY